MDSPPSLGAPKKAEHTPGYMGFLFIQAAISPLLRISTTTVTIQQNFLGWVICGVIWGLSFIVPGLSSSSVLLYMGLYEPMTAGIAAFDLAVLLPLLLGLAITVVSLARLVNNLYEKHYALVSRLILGFVVASSLKIVPAEFESVGTLVLSLVCFGAGFALARYMDCAREKQKA